MPDTPDNPPDPDVTIPVSKPPASIPRNDAPDLPLPEELTALLPGGNYQVESFLGQGGMGAVYKGTQVRLKRPVAIKIMRRDQGQDYGFEQRFEREAQAMAKLNHPNIVSVIDYGEAGPDYLYIVMELVNGADLMDVIRGGQMTQEMALTLLPQICDALQFAHDHGIVHRDIKPSNIMVTRDGRVKMADFGLAKPMDGLESGFRTQTGTGMGTPDYAAPEQFDAHAHIDHRADIYALGVMIYQMITGQLPRGAWKPPSQRAEIAPEWDDIVAHAMQSDPADRYQQASEVKTDLSKITPPCSASVSDAANCKASVSDAANCRASVSDATAGKPPAKHAQPSHRDGLQSAAPQKSRAPLLFGLITGAVVLAVGAFFALKQPVGHDVRSLTSDQANTTGAEPKGDEQPRLLTSSPTKSEPLPESGWQPMFTEAEWKQSEQNWEFKDGQMHVKEGARRKDWPAADGAIRARISIRDGSMAPGLVVRQGPEGSYKLVLGTDAITVSINSYGRDAKAERQALAKLRLPKRLQPGDILDLELHVEGDRLTGIVNGKERIEARDARLKLSGSWGPAADDGWFESVEVQPIPAVSPSPPLPVSKSSYAIASRDAPFTNTLGMKFVPVPITGGPTDGERVLFSVWETRVKDYGEFYKESKRPWPSVSFPNPLMHPVVNVTWEDAQAFCAWLNERERKAGKLGTGQAYRLPSDHEWSCAAGIGDREDAAKSPTVKNGKGADAFPWGTQWPPPSRAGNYRGGEWTSEAGAIPGYSDGFTHTAPAGSFDANALGLFDLGGNISEWCEDIYNQSVPDEGHVLRGSAFVDGRRDYLLSSYRVGRASSADARGFRIVLAPITQKPAPSAASAPTPDAATKDAPFLNSLGMKFVPVPIVGGLTGGQRVLFSVWETRAQDYEAFAKETKREWPKPEFEQGPTHPAVMVSREDAQAFCAWLTEKERKADKLGAKEVYRLPSDHEWSCAVEIGAREDAARLPGEKDEQITGIHPWGTAWPPPANSGNYCSEEIRPLLAAGKLSIIRDWLHGYQDGHATTAPVGSFAPNANGLHDLGGNVWEWCADWADAGKTTGVGRGASWNDYPPGRMLSSKRIRPLPESANFNLGFRCVLATATPGRSSRQAVTGTHRHRGLE